MRESAIARSRLGRDFLRGAMMEKNEREMDGAYFYTFCARWGRHLVCLFVLPVAVFAPDMDSAVSLAGCERQVAGESI